MSQLLGLVNATHKAKSGGHIGLFTTQDLAHLLGKESNQSFSKFLHKAVKKNLIEKVCKNIFINPSSPPTGKGILFHIAKILRWDEFLYISLESQLSYLGIISQVVIDRLTIMTTGRSYLIKTKYGTIEFTHTSRSLESIKDGVYFDGEISGFRAYKERAIGDLKRVGRNVAMINEEHNAE